MWRAFFLALGISMAIIGVECLVIDKAVIAVPNKQKQTTLGIDTTNLLSTSASARREFQPPEWAPWSLLSGGVVISIYSFTLRRG